MGESVRSTCVSEVEYDVTSQALTITFTDGSTYTYDGVPYDVYDNLVNFGNTWSAGQYFNFNIRNRYSFR